jgi:hypothetical protein
LDIVVGLVFIYLLYSLLATLVQEIIATHFSFRAKMLERAIFRMLEDENKFNSRFSGIRCLFARSKNSGRKNSPSGEFYKHPLIKFLSENSSKSRPSYINRHTFSKVIVDLLRGDEARPEDNEPDLIQSALDQGITKWGNVEISSETLTYLRSVWTDAKSDVQAFKLHLEGWFDETMDRTTGWYKKHTQFILFFVGFAIAVVFNVDTLKIVDKLEKDPKLREQLVQQAGAFMEAHPDLDVQLKEKELEYKSALAELKNRELQPDQDLAGSLAKDSLELEKYRLLQARRDTLLNHAESLIRNDIANVQHSLGMDWNGFNCQSGWKNCLVNLLKSLFGWTITAIALSLGAPFWFDLLNKLMKLRASVATPTSDDKEKKQG